MGQNWSILVPEATVNLCTNPSFEKATTGWVASGSNTIARNASQQYAGVYALLCTYQNSLTLASYAVASGVFGAARTYTVTAKLYVPDSWDGGDINLDATGFTGITVTQVRQWASTDEKEKWVELEIKFTIISDVTGSIILETDSPPTASRQVYLDSVQIEEKAHATSYCDGDQDGCTWNGVDHAASSTRDQFEASGGRVMNLDTDLGFLTGLDEGTGVFPLEVLSQPQPLLPGDKFQGLNILSRSNLLLRGGFEGDTTPEFHNKRRAMVKALNSRVGPVDRPPQPRQLIYHGAAVDKQIGVHYVSGLGVRDRIGTLGERIDGLQFSAPDPRWYSLGERGAVLATKGSSTLTRFAGRVNGQWGGLGSPAINQDCQCMAYDATYIYLGGFFTNFAGDSNADYIVRYNYHTGAYSSMGSGANLFVYSLAVGPDGSVYAGGTFTSIGGTAVTGIAKWSGAGWSKLGTTGVSGGGARVNAIAIGPDGSIYIGGSFTAVNGVSASNIAKWDGVNWSALGAGTNGTVYALAFDKNSNLYVGGAFTTAGGDANCRRIARWDGAWSDMNQGFNNDTVRDIEISNDGTIYVCGGFTVTITPEQVVFVARWNGSRWIQVGDGNFTGTIAYKLFSTGNLIYVSGNLSLASQPRNGVLVWNGSRWGVFDLDFETPLSGYILDMAEINGDLYITGGFDDPVTYSGLTTIQYSGTEIAYPVFEISRSGGDGATITSLRNELTNAILNMDYPLLDGEKLTVDLRPDRLSVYSSYYGPVPKAILPGGDTASFYLTPGNGSNDQDNLITCFVVEENSPTVTAVIRWRETHQSYD